MQIYIYVYTYVGGGFEYFCFSTPNLLNMIPAIPVIPPKLPVQNNGSISTNFSFRDRGS